MAIGSSLSWKKSLTNAMMIATLSRHRPHVFFDDEDLA
jgi:hypothetical protein